jgi:spermidine/putrescine-binding protein
MLITKRYLKKSISFIIAVIMIIAGFTVFSTEVYADSYKISTEVDGYLEVVYTNKKVTSFTQEMGVDVNPVIYDEDIDLLKQRQQDAEEFLKSLDKTVWCAIPSDTELTQNFSNDDLVIFYRGIDIDLLMQQYPQYKYYKLNITEAADCKGKGE